MTEASDGPPEEVVRIVDRLRELVAVNRGVERHLATAMRLNATDLHAMEFLSRVGTSTPTGLAEELGVSTPAATFAVDRLSKRGHVTRQPHQEDRRKTVVAPSAPAVEEVVGLLAPLTTRLSAYLDAMPVEDRRTAADFLDDVVALYRAAQQEWTEAQG